MKYTNLDHLLDVEMLDKISESFYEDETIDMLQFLKPEAKEKLTNWCKNIYIKNNNYKNNPLITEYQNEIRYRKKRDEEHQFRDTFRYSFLLSATLSKGKIEYRENKPVLDIRVSKDHIERALAIVSVLIGLVKDLGGKVYVQQENKDNIIINLSTHSFSFKVREIMQKRRSLISLDQSIDRSFRPLYEEIPSGILQIEISTVNSYWNKGNSISSCKLEDTNNSLLEDQFSSIFNFIIRETIRLEMQRYKLDKLNEKEMIEERRIQEIKRKRFEKEKVLENIESQMEKWSRSKELLSFADELEDTILDLRDNLSKKLLSYYVSLVREKAESVNPMEDILNEVKSITDKSD